MEQFLFYQLKVAILAAILVLLYKVFLGKQTFHRFNRIMLLLIAVASVTLPLVRIDALKTDLTLIQKPVSSTQAPKSDVSVPVEDTFTAQVFEESDEETFISEAPAEPASSITVIKPAEEPAPMEEAKTPIWVICLIAAYGIGLLWFVISYVRSLGSVKHLIDEGRYADRREGCDLIESELKGKGNSFKFRANDVYLKKKFHQAMFVPNPEDGTTNMKWELVIFPPTREE